MLKYKKTKSKTFSVNRKRFRFIVLMIYRIINIDSSIINQYNYQIIKIE